MLTRFCMLRCAGRRIFPSRVSEQRIRLPAPRAGVMISLRLSREDARPRVPPTPSFAAAGCTHRAHDPPLGRATAPPGSAAPTCRASLGCPRHRLIERTTPRAPPPHGPASSVLAVQTACGFSPSSQTPPKSTESSRHLIKIGRAPPGLVLAPLH